MTPSHVYDHCGTCPATCTVTDDGGSDEMVVRVIDVANRHFEDGFARRGAGDVVNGWEPYRMPGPPARAWHAPSNVPVHGGRRAQGMRTDGGGGRA